MQAPDSTPNMRNELTRDCTSMTAEQQPNTAHSPIHHTLPLLPFIDSRQHRKKSQTVLLASSTTPVLATDTSLVNPESVQDPMRRGTSTCVTALHLPFSIRADGASARGLSEHRDGGTEHWRMGTREHVMVRRRRFGNGTWGVYHGC